MLQEINDDGLLKIIQDFSVLADTTEKGYIFIQQDDCQTCHKVLEELKTKIIDKTIYVYTLHRESLANEKILEFMKCLRLSRTPIICSLPAVCLQINCRVVESAKEVEDFVNT